MTANFRQFLEVKYTTDTVQQIKDKLLADGYVSVFLDEKGNVQIGYPQRPDSLSMARARKSLYNSVSISSSTKTVTIEMIGDKVLAGHKKLIKFLIDNQIIDNSWHLKGGGQPAEYVGWNFAHFPDPNMPKTAGEVKGLSIISPAIENIVLYHGTSEYDWEKIQKAGALYPLFTASNKEHGFESRGKLTHNKDFLYLATDMDKAWDYAKSRAGDVSRKTDKEGWAFKQNSGTENWPVRPVLLRINIPDITKLRADDDVVASKMRDIARKLWDKKPKDEQQRIMRELSIKKGWKIDDPSVGVMIWRESPEGIEEIMAKLNPKIYRAWLASALKEKQIAYKGFIPLKYIQEVPVFPRRN